MKPTCCDTSFLFSFYGRDAHTARAKAAMAGLAAPLALSPLNEYEFLNALRLAVFRKVLPATDSAMMQAAFERDIAAGKLVMARCDLADILAEANGVSAARTPKRRASGV